MTAKTKNTTITLHLNKTWRVFTIRRNKPSTTAKALNPTGGPTCPLPHRSSMKQIGRELQPEDTSLHNNTEVDYRGWPNKPALAAKASFCWM